MSTPYSTAMINSQEEGGRNWHLDGRAAHCPALHITAVLRGCEGLGYAQQSRDLIPKAIDTLMRPSGGLWGARVPSCLFYMRPTECVRTLPAEAMGLIANTQLSASRTLPTALGPVENGHHHPAS